MLQRGMLRLSKRKKKTNVSFSSEDDSRSSISEQLEEWSKYDDRLLDSLYKSDIPKLKETLRKKGVSPVKLSRDGQTAMHIAVKRSMMECVDCFLSENPDLSTTDGQGRTTYHIASSNGDTIMLKKILDYSNNSLDTKDNNNMSALHYAVKSGDAGCVKLLLDNNSPLETQDNELRTPLLQAVTEGHEKIATMLILHEVKLNARDNKERTPLMLACIQGMSQVAALLLSKGADVNVKDTDGKSLEIIASEAGHSEIVDVLRSRIDSGIVDMDMMDGSDSIEADSNKENKPQTPQTPDGTIVENGVHLNGDVFSSEKVQRHHSGSSVKRQSMGKFEDNSFTSSIIESLMGFDVSSDTISEMSATEDQLHMKIEEDQHQLEVEISEKDKRIEVLETEMLSVKCKLKLEMEMRFAAEKEVLDLKQQRDVLMQNIENISQDNITFGSDQHLPGDDTVDEEHQEEQHIDDEAEVEHVNHEVGEEEDENVDVEQEEEDEDQSSEDKEHDEEEAEHSVDDENNINEETDMGHQVHFADSDSDESVSQTTGYRKKSLGTAKQHIDMLEEHILSLEEDLATKDNEICDLETKLQSTKELVDLNNNTTVSLELFNELKNEKIVERSSFKKDIRILESKVDKLEEMERITSAEKAVIETRLQTECENTNELKNKLEEINEKVESLQKQLHECNESYEKTIACYRNNMIHLHQNELDATLKDVLVRIVKLRSC